MQVELRFERADCAALLFEHALYHAAERLGIFGKRSFIEWCRAVEVQPHLLELLGKLIGQYKVAEDIGNAERVRLYLVVLGGGLVLLYSVRAQYNLSIINISEPTRRS